ncbi:MAG: glutamate racemase [Oligoflexales bacterium]|nr:glutamate racemase [Oligoflexales bacterium]
MNTDHQYRIVLLDSGIGGFSILKSLLNQFHNSHFFYYLDRKNFPYGTKSEAQVKKIVLEASAWLKSEYKPDLFVVACNTASTAVLSELRSELDFPVVGVVPAIKPAAELSKTKNIALLATNGTIQRHYIRELINQHAEGCEIQFFGSEILVALAEKKIMEKNLDLDMLKKEMAPFFNEIVERNNIDVVVLGCTHFSFLIEELKSLATRPIAFVDSVEGVTRRIKAVLESLEVKIDENQSPPLWEIISSSNLSADESANLKNFMQGFEIKMRKY